MMPFFRRRDWLVMSVAPWGEHYVYRRCWSQYAADHIARAAQEDEWHGWAYYVRHRTDKQNVFPREVRL